MLAPYRGGGEPDIVSWVQSVSFQIQVSPRTLNSLKNGPRFRPPNITTFVAPLTWLTLLNCAIAGYMRFAGTWAGVFCVQSCADTAPVKNNTTAASAAART